MPSGEILPLRGIRISGSFHRREAVRIDIRLENEKTKQQQCDQMPDKTHHIPAGMGFIL